jgi:hypothetical protein
MLKFDPYGNGDEIFIAYIDNRFYRVSYASGNNIPWSSEYSENNKIRRYLSNKLKLESYYGYGVPTNCRFSTKEEAFAICERHYKLLLLQ